MGLPELVLLDVGHGSSAILHRDGRAIVIDAPATPTLYAALDHLAITQIDALLISHADSDHISGAAALLTDYDRRPVHAVYLNADQPRRSRTYDSFRRAVKFARDFGTVVHVALTSDTAALQWGDVTVRVLHPAPDLALGGPGSLNDAGRTQSANSLSAVLQLWCMNVPVCLLTGDLDRIGFDSMQTQHVDMRSNVLIFPHHGGAPAGADARQFAEEITRVVDPALVVISLGRNRYGNPIPEIVAGIIHAQANAPHLACTQLSSRCSTVAAGSQDHLSAIPARGRKNNACCAGSLGLPLNSLVDRLLVPKLMVRHSTFVRSEVKTGLCTGGK